MSRAATNLLPLGAVLAGILAFALTTGGRSGDAAAAAPTAAPAQLDVEIAVDGTGSMGKVLAQTERDATGALQGVTALLPNTHFAVVVFRDFNNPAGEYELLQQMTSDRAQVGHALSRIKTSSNPTRGNGSAESYNLAFHKSYSDPAIGWRPEARKVVVVLGDAEPNGAGTAGLPGCKDGSLDPHGLSTPRELEHMRSTRRTLVMVREVSPYTTAALRCYQSLAAGAFAGGIARDAGSTDVASTIAALVQSVYAPLTLTPDLGLALPGQRTGYTIAVPNPNSFPLLIDSLGLNLPSTAFRYLSRTTSGSTSAEPTRAGGTLLWSLAMPLASRQRVRVHVLVRAPRKIGTYKSMATIHVRTDNGDELTTQSLVRTLRVQRRVHAIAVHVRGWSTSGSALRGSASARFAPGVRHLPGVAPARGAFVLRRPGSAFVLRATRVQLERLAEPTRVRVAVRVLAARGARCRRGARGTLLVLGSPLLRRDGSTHDVLVLKLPRQCGGTAIRFSNDAPPRGGASVSASAS
jgi:hypothetical protein